MLLYLVRHGETDWNKARRIQGMTDIPLNETGREQAARTGRLLAGRPWDAIITSPLSRAFETGSIIAAELGLPTPTTNDKLVERNYGEAEGLDFTELHRLFPDDAPVPGREKRSAVASRAIDALLHISEEHPGQSVIVVSHGGLIRSVLRRLDPDAEYGMITNGSVHSFRVDDGALRLIAFDDPIEAESTEGDEGTDLRDQNAMEARK